jgi:hypothetical protein
MRSILDRLINQPGHRKSTHWLKIRGADSKGKKAKRRIHREERRATKAQLRQSLDSI